MIDTLQEEAFVRAFIVPEKQERYLFFLAHPQRRQKILRTLYHTLAVVESRATRITGGEHFPEPVEAMLKRKGAGPTCYLISPNPTLDQREMPLREALDTLLMQDTIAVACCLPGRLAYYKAEQGGYLLERKPSLPPVCLRRRANVGRTILSPAAPAPALFAYSPCKNVELPG